jgi:hypothetical protein
MPNLLSRGTRGGGNVPGLVGRSSVMPGFNLGSRARRGGTNTNMEKTATDKTNLPIQPISERSRKIRENIKKEKDN